jgi:hypothetical protein
MRRRLPGTLQDSVAFMAEIAFAGERYRTVLEIDGKRRRPFAVEM